VARLRLVGMPLGRIRQVADLPREAAAAAVTSYWRQVEADTGPVVLVSTPSSRR